MFIPVYSNILAEDYKLLIFDRWGNLVFQSDKPDLGWNGTWQGTGKQVQQDVYVYRINYTDNMYKKYELIGHVTLLR